MTVEQDLEQLRSGTAWVDRSDRGVVTVSGPDTFSFLQALVSQDLDPLADGDAVPSLLLTPQGKLDVQFQLVRVNHDEAWLDCDPGMGAQLATSLDRFRIRVKAELADRTGELGMLSFGNGARELVPDGFVTARSDAGCDVLGPCAQLERVIERLDDAGRPAASREAYEAWRIERGIPMQPYDLDGSTIPQEAFLDRHAVSFTKGCFIGQELVCRIDTRGHVNRHLRRFEHIEGSWPARGAEVVVNDKVVGALTSVAPIALSTGALGYVRREVEPPTDVELRWPDGSARARVVEL